MSTYNFNEIIKLLQDLDKIQKERKRQQDQFIKKKRKIPVHNHDGSTIII